MTHDKFRSSEWFQGSYKSNYVHRSWMKNRGFPADLCDDRPVIGI